MRSFGFPPIRFIEHPVAGCEEVDRRQHGNDNQQDPGERGGIAHLKMLERLLVQKQRIDIRRVNRAALGDDERRGEHLEGADHAEHQIEEHDRRQHRERNMEKLLDFAGPVDRGRFVQFLWNLLEARQENDHRGAELPGAEQNERAERRARVRDPADTLNAEPGEHLVDVAVQAEHVPPQHGHRDAAADQRREVDRRAVQAHAAGVIFQEQRDHERKEQLDRDGKQHEQKRHRQ